MSELKNGTTFIYAEKPQQCDSCGNIRELRPYGKDGACICYECAMKDPETTNEMMRVKLFGEKPKDKPK